MASRDDIISFCDDLLHTSSFGDYCPNGMQVEGAREVSSVAMAVSSTLEVFQRAVQAGAQLLLVHHGLYWRTTPQVVTGSMRTRLGTLLAADVSLVTYHLPLDAHRELGNNALLARGLELEVEPDTVFAPHDGHSIGCVARPAQPLPASALAEQVGALVERTPLVLGAEVTQVRRVAICSGGGAGYLQEAADLGADVLLTGEPTEPLHAAASELGMAVIAAGHYATETFGVRALGERIASEFAVTASFIDVANPV
jgi:dinuclear metal center YbgI/SA1388 family protein